MNEELWSGLIALLIRILLMLFAWIAFSVGLYKVLRKLNVKRAGTAWIPGFRYFSFGKALGRPVEGIFAGLLEVLYFVLSLIPEPDNERLTLIRALLLLIVVITLYIYRIRLFLRMIEVFGKKARWILLWLAAEWLAMLIFGFSKKLQPALSILGEEQSGEEPSSGLETGRAPAHLAASGLSVNLRARTVRDYGKKRYLLKDINVEIPNGSLVMLLGGSGAGKTTFINAVIGYEKADTTILLNGADVYADYQNLKYRIGFVPQQNLMRGNDTVQDTVRDSAEMRLPTGIKRKERNERVREVLGQLGLLAGDRGLVCKKSGGQLRRIAIAQELVADPELFVLDEPDSGLDGAIAREIFTKLRAIADTGKIVIVITHTPDRVVDLFDRVIILAKDSDRIGRLAFYGTPQEARAFFERDTMEDIVVSVNRAEEGGEGLADHFVEKYAALTAVREGGAA